MMDWDRITQTGARTPGVRAVPGPILRYRCDLCSQTQSWNSTVGLLIRRMVTNGTSMLRMLGASLSDWRLGRSHLTRTPSSRTGENPPYGMIEGIVETSASFEARYAPRSYSTAGGKVQVLSATRLVVLMRGGVKATEQKVKQVLARMELKVNEEKSRVVDAREGTFDFLGFTFCC